MNREAAAEKDAGRECAIVDVAVVGAGAAGLMASIASAEAGARVILFNSRPRIGLKILISGGTRCNITHQTVGPESFHGASRHAVRMVLDAFPAEATREWFEGIGVALKLEPGGKTFPASNSARTVLAALRTQVEARGVELRSGEKVVAVSAGAPTTTAFRLFTAAGEYRARCVILSTGGLSFPATGSDGSGYELARSLGHRVTELTPALTPLLLGGDLHRRLQGLTLPAALTLRLDGRRAVTTAGSLLFTHFGMSGPVALDMSRHWLRAPGERARELTAHFLPGDLESAGGLERAEQPGGLPDLSALEKEWLAAAAANPRSTVQSHFAERLPLRLVREIAAEAGLDHTLLLARASREDRRRLLAALTSLSLAVEGTLGYGKAEVTAGGVPLEEVDPRRMASRKCAGLFLAGEILDVDGRLGGYNFQWAWSSGRVAGRAAAAWARDRGGDVA